MSSVSSTHPSFSTGGPLGDVAKRQMSFHTIPMTGIVSCFLSFLCKKGHASACCRGPTVVIIKLTRHAPVIFVTPPKTAAAPTMAYSPGVIQVAIDFPQDDSKMYQ